MVAQVASPQPIRCPRGTLPLQPTLELLQGFDTATQITALAHWLRPQTSPRIALGSQGMRVGPADWPTPSPATGSTGAWLAPQVAARKRAATWGVGGAAPGQDSP